MYEIMCDVMYDVMYDADGMISCMMPWNAGGRERGKKCCAVQCSAVLQEHINSDLGNYDRDAGRRTRSKPRGDALCPRSFPSVACLNFLILYSKYCLGSRIDYCRLVLFRFFVSMC